MKPQSVAFLEKAAELLQRAEAMLRIGLYEDAGRTAYLAGFHAAQALIFEAHDRVFKSHSAVHGEFSRLAKGDARFDLEGRAFLGRAFNLKTIADYATGPGEKLGEEHAVDTVAVARRMVSRVKDVLENPD